MKETLTRMYEILTKNGYILTPPLSEALIEEDDFSVFALKDNISERIIIIPSNDEECISDHTLNNLEFDELMDQIIDPPVTHKTNVEFVTELMEFSKNGALIQAFVIECLDKWSQTVIENEQDLLEKMANSFINPKAWVNCAKEVKEKLNNRNK